MNMIRLTRITMKNYTTHFLLMNICYIYFSYKILHMREKLKLKELGKPQLMNITYCYSIKLKFLFKEMMLYDL